MNQAIELYEEGVLEKYNVELLGAQINAIEKAEDRENFKKEMDQVSIETAKGNFVYSWEEAKNLLDEINFPVIIRPSFTLGGTGGSVAYNFEEFQGLVENGISSSPINEILIEESLIGWKEYEFEVVRDKSDNVIILSLIHI